MTDEQKGNTEQLEILHEETLEENKDNVGNAEHIYVSQKEAEEKEDVSHTGNAAGASIEMETEDDDDAEQVASLFSSLSTRYRRRTMDIIARRHAQLL